MWNFMEIQDTGNIIGFGNEVKTAFFKEITCI